MSTSVKSQREPMPKREAEARDRRLLRALQNGEPPHSITKRFGMNLPALRKIAAAHGIEVKTKNNGRRKHPAAAEGPDRPEGVNP